MTASRSTWKSRYKNYLRKILRKALKKQEDEKYRKKMKCIKLLSTYSIQEVAEFMDVSVRTIQRWKGKVKSEGLVGLREKSKRPHRIHRVSDKRIEEVVTLRKETGEGCEKIGLNVGISSRTVHKILTKLGLISRKKKKKRCRHFQRKHANSLWQMDFSQLYEDLWVLIIIDDHSRFIVGYKLMKTPNVDDTLDLLNDCISTYGSPKQILTDHGSQFFSVRGGVSTFDIYCLKNYIKHILARVRHPQTSGKVERKIGVIKEELDRKGFFKIRPPDEILEKTLEQYTEYHNYSRYHFTYERYTFGDIEKKKKIAFIPYLRFVCHRT